MKRGAASTPTAVPPGATRPASRSVVSPNPQPMSSTRSPGLGPSSSIAASPCRAKLPSITGWNRRKRSNSGPSQARIASSFAASAPACCSMPAIFSPRSPMVSRRCVEALRRPLKVARPAGRCAACPNGVPPMLATRPWRAAAPVLDHVPCRPPSVTRLLARRIIGGPTLIPAPREGETYRFKVQDGARRKARLCPDRGGPARRGLRGAAALRDRDEGRIGAAGLLARGNVPTRIKITSAGLTEVGIDRRARRLPALRSAAAARTRGHRERNAPAPGV